MFPGGNANANLGYNKHNQYMAQPPHFLAAPAIPGPCSIPITGPGSGVVNPMGAAAPGMPLNMQGGIDWAQLAQQWIHMRDSTAASQLSNFSMTMPVAPPPPIINNAQDYQLVQQPEQRQPQGKAQLHYEEHGEAEMDMDMDEEESGNNGRAAHVIESLPPPPVVTQSQWAASRAHDVPPVTVSSNDAVGSGTPQWNDWSPRNNPTAHIPSLLKLNVCNPNEPLQPQIPLPQPISSIGGVGVGSGNVSSEIDANKRKMLPAWIREGLEKMEREKQRQLERQQPPTPEAVSPEINVKQVSSKTLTTPVNLLNMSNVASDSDDSSAAPEEATLASNMAHQLIGNDVLSRASNSDGEPDDNEEKEHAQQQQPDAVSSHNVATVASAANAEAALSGKNYEERLADLMLVVRRTLTEILLETTNEEIAAIATETLKAHRAKASSAQVIRKSALSSITGNLGLAVYGDSSSESDDDNADDNDGGQVERFFDSSADKSSELSADELKARIRKSKRAFERVIDDIEERVSLQEQLDEQKLLHYRKLELEQTEANRKRAVSEQRHTDSPADDAAATATTTSASTNEKLQQFNGKRLSRKERTTRFSDNKDGKQPPTYVSQVVAVSASQNSIMPQKLKPVPNPATNLLQMPEAMATMLSAADKALDKANKTSKKSKGRRRQSTSSSSSSSSGDSSSSSSSSGSNSSSNSSKSSSNSDDSSTRSSAAAKKHGKSSQRQRRSSRGSSGHRQRIDSSRKGHHRKGHSSASSMHSYDRQHSGRERDRDRHAVHYNRQYGDRRRRHRRDSSHSTEENGGSGYRRHSSSRSHQSSSYGKHRERTRSRSNSRSTHNSHSSASTSHQQRKRK